MDYGFDGFQIQEIHIIYNPPSSSASNKALTRIIAPNVVYKIFPRSLGYRFISKWCIIPITDRLEQFDKLSSCIDIEYFSHQMFQSHGTTFLYTCNDIRLIRAFVRILSV